MKHSESSSVSSLSVCISLHDVAPATWPACERLLQMIDALGAGPVTLLVVPDFHRLGAVDQSPEFCRAIEQRLARGDEVALHGYFHLDDAPTPHRLKDWFQRRIMTAAEAEFAALGLEQASRRIDAGLTMLQTRGWPVHGFVAPAWQLGEDARAVLAKSALSYTTTRTEILQLPEWRAFKSPSLVYSVRSAARRWLSSYWNDFLTQRLAASPLLRISLHPADAAFPQVLAYWQRLIGDIAQQRQPMTKYAWVTAQS